MREYSRTARVTGTSVHQVFLIYPIFRLGKIVNTQRTGFFSCFKMSVHCRNSRVDISTEIWINFSSFKFHLARAQRFRRSFSPAWLSLGQPSFPWACIWSQRSTTTVIHFLCLLWLPQSTQPRKALGFSDVQRYSLRKKKLGDCVSCCPWLFRVHCGVSEVSEGAKK